MNKINRLLIFSALLLWTVTTHAQNFRNNPKLQERITQAKLTEIQRGLNLDEAQMKELSPIYKRYEAELNSLRTAGQGRLLQTNPDSLSAEEADKIISSHLDNAIKMGTIRKKYYPEFRAVLSPQQVMRLYQSEAKLRRRVMMELRRRFGEQSR
ncbi:Spy/CpxP family protein refolding chaperone [Pontibacter locisalis]|uniref:Spy/CpxP family protein refolding chaperone n=1 Tax=Pontibacter locisalis TaxID=1719035 RepID=A0ABW5IHT1_9BACT